MGALSLYLIKYCLLMSGDWADDFSRLRFSNLEEKKAGIEINYDDNGVCD